MLKKETLLKGVGVLGCGYFTMSLLFWALFLWPTLRDAQASQKGWSVINWLAVLPILVPQVLSCGFVAVFYLADKKSKLAAAVVCLLSLSALAFFVNDIKHENYQLQMTTDKGCIRYYCTWWTYQNCE